MKWGRLILVAFLLLNISCVGGRAPRDRLVVAIESNPTTFDPRLAVSAYSIKINQLIFNGLVKYDEHFDFVPDLAERYEMPDDRSYRFYLKRGVLFHDGSEMTADDVLYSYQSITDGTVPSPHKSSFDYVEEIRKEGDYTVFIRLKEPFAPFLTAMKIGIISKGAALKLGDSFGASPVGTGPYRLTEFVSDSHVLLAANENYYGGKPRLPFLEFKVLKDDNVRVLQLMKGNVDLVQNAIPPVLLDMLARRQGLAAQFAPSTVFTYLGMNLSDERLSKINVRRAIAHGIDRGEIIKHKWEGRAKMANTLLAPDNWAYTDDVAKYGYDTERAKKLLDEAGYIDPDGSGPKMRFFLSYKTSTQKQRIDIANLIAEQLKKIGIGVTVTPYEWGTFFRDIQTGNFQIYSLSWVGITEPDIYYSIYNSSQFPPDGMNRNRFVNEDIDRLTALGRVTLDQGKRREIYARIQKIASEDLPYVPLWYEDTIVVRRDDVLGYKIEPDASFMGVVDVTKE